MRDNLMTIAEAAEKAKLTRTTICRWLAQGRFEAVVRFSDVMSPRTPKRTKEGK